MKYSTLRTLIFVALVAIWACLILVPAAAAQARDVAVIVNPNNSATNVTLSDLRKIFSGEKHSWPGGAPIKLLLSAPGSRERLVLLKLLGMSESDYKQFWTAQIVRGEADAEPVSLPSFGMVKEAVQVYHGAIACVDYRDIRPGMLMKVLKVDGRLPGESGYPLH